MKLLLIIQLVLALTCAALIHFGNSLALWVALAIAALTVIMLIMVIIRSLGRATAGEAHASDVLMAARRHKHG